MGRVIAKMDYMYSSRLPNELPFFIRIRGFAEYGIYSRMDSIWHNALIGIEMQPSCLVRPIYYTYILST